MRRYTVYQPADIADCPELAAVRKLIEAQEKEILSLEQLVEDICAAVSPFLTSGPRKDIPDALAQALRHRADLLERIARATSRHHDWEGAVRLAEQALFCQRHEWPQLVAEALGVAKEAMKLAEEYAGAEEHDNNSDADRCADGRRPMKHNPFQGTINGVPIGDDFDVCGDAPQHGEPARIRTGREVQITGPGLLYDGEVIRTAIMDPDCAECEKPEQWEALHEEIARLRRLTREISIEIRQHLQGDIHHWGDRLEGAW
jgi:hypothetical protein